MGPHRIQSSCGTQKKFQSDGYIVRNRLSHMKEYPKIDPPHIKSSGATQNENSNLTGIGLKNDYVTWRNGQKWSQTTSNLHVRYKIKIPTLRV